MGIQRPMTQAGISILDKLEVVTIKPSRDQGSTDIQPILEHKYLVSSDRKGDGTGKGEVAL